MSKISDLTRTVKIERKVIAAVPQCDHVLLNYAVELILQLAAVTSSQIAYHTNTTISSSKTKFVSVLDPLYFFTNYYPMRNQTFARLKTSEIASERTFWINFVLTNIVDAFINNHASYIKKHDIRYFLNNFFSPKYLPAGISEDLLTTLKVIDPQKLKSDFCVVNPSYCFYGKDAKHAYAEADVILDNTLIDMKNCCRLEFAKYKCQLLYYYFLDSIAATNKLYRDNDGYFKKQGVSIESVGLFFSRFNLRFDLPVEDLFISKSCLEKAKKIFLEEVVGCYE